jgi:hypothetical protein
MSPMPPLANQGRARTRPAARDQGREDDRAGAPTLAAGRLAGARDFLPESPPWALATSQRISQTIVGKYDIICRTICFMAQQLTQPPFPVR